MKEFNMLDRTSKEAYEKDIEKVRELSIRFVKAKRDDILEVVNSENPTSIEEVNQEYFASGFIHAVIIFSLVKDSEVKRYMDNGGDLDKLDVIDLTPFIQSIVEDEETADENC
jgi:hypothetical protein